MINPWSDAVISRNRALAMHDWPYSTRGSLCL